MHCAKNHFDKVLYVPINRIGIESNENGVVPFLKNKNLLSFDVVLSRTEKEYRDMGYVLAKIFEDNGKYMPVNYKAILLGTSEFLVPVYFGLKNNGVKSPRTYFASSKQAIIQNFDNFKYPVTVKLPYQKDGAMIMDSKESAIGVIDTMEKLDQPILVQEAVKTSEKLRILVAGKSVYALKNEQAFALSKEYRKAMLDTAKTIGAQICQINAVAHADKLFVLGISVAPRMMIFEKVFGEGVINNAMKEIRADAQEFFNDSEKSAVH
ncbi:Ribosomal protein S6--L-glutamate ligase [uncultured archaeon]|nr:Ribosomal protein S6--L-glutamate ligase [uncultured archaeon]